MPKVYITDRGIASVLTGTTAVHELPVQLRIVSGITPPAAGAGSKQLAGKARVRTEIVAQLHHKYLSAALTNTITIIRCSLAINGVEGITLDGVLSNHVTSTCTLYVEPRVVEMSGTLTDVVTASCDLYLAGRMDATLRCRTVSNATLFIGDHHQTAGLLQSKISANARLTTNYMRALMRMPISASCMLHVAHPVAGTATIHQTATADLQDLRAFAASVSLTMTATARLTMPLQAFAPLRVTALAVPDVQRYFTGSSLERITAVAALTMERTLAGAVTVRQTAALDADVPRLFAAKVYLKTTAGASLDVGRQLSSLILCHWTAAMNFQPARPVLSPIFAEVFVNPEMDPTATTPGDTVVEEVTNSVYVEEDE